ncbi:hypothetical protein A2U01_0081885, partial [Trifolium medium]|nr:hypothetical protein [Trifolium medium]
MACSSSTNQTLPLAGKWTNTLLQMYAPRQVPEPPLKTETKELWEKQ